jgi:cell division protein ZapA
VIESQKIYPVDIAGVPLRLKSSHDDDTVRELVANVNARVNEALATTKSGSIQTAAILASLHFAEELLTLKRKTQADLKNLESKAEKVLADLDDSRVTELGL